MKTRNSFYEIKIENTITTSFTLKNYKIYLITMDKISQFWYFVNHGVSDMAKLLDIRYVWEAPQTRNVDEQIDIIKNAVNNGANAIMLAAIDPVIETSAVEDAKALGVKIIYVDSPTNEECIVTLATDNYSAGITAGQTMITELEAQGIQRGSIGIVGVDLETATNINRENGFRSVIEANGRFKLLNTQYTGGNKIIAQSAAHGFIAGNSDLVGLYGTNEDTTIGVGNAIKTSNQLIIGIGFDITEEIQEFINQGYLKAVMVQNPYTMGYLGLAETMAALNNFDTGPVFINTGINVRTRYTH